MEGHQLELWRKATAEHISKIEQLVREDREIKRMFIEHLDEFFKGYSKIDFSENFDKVTIRWEYGEKPLIDVNKISRLGMYCSIGTEFDDSTGRGVAIEVYPFGIKGDDK